MFILSFLKQKNIKTKTFTNRWKTTVFSQLVFSSSHYKVKLKKTKITQNTLASFFHCMLNNQNVAKSHKIMTKLIKNFSSCHLQSNSEMVYTVYHCELYLSYNIPSFAMWHVYIARLMLKQYIVLHTQHVLYRSSLMLGPGKTLIRTYVHTHTPAHACKHSTHSNHPPNESPGVEKPTVENFLRPKLNS